jgi:hypothetical protein
LQRSATPAVEGVENGAWQRGIHGVRAGRLAPVFACRTYRQPLILLDRGQGKVNAPRPGRAPEASPSTSSLDTSDASKSREKEGRGRARDAAT